MTCKECLHYEACNYWLKKDNKYLANTEGFICDNFTDCSEWVHLPCKVEDTVFYLRGAYYKRDRSGWKVTPIKVTEISTKIGRSNKLYPLSIIANGTRYPLTSIGKTVFLTREEAEKALEEKENESKN